MNWHKVWRLGRHDYVKLVPILALAFYIAFIPNQNYPYPVHIDEWRHIAESNALLQAAATNHHDPFTGGTAIFRMLLESGFHLFWGVFHQISGISWIAIVRYFPSIIFMLTVLSVYNLTRREGFGWEAALFTSLMPTTVGIMGPAFFVPVALALPFVPLSLFIVFNYRTRWSYVALFLITGFLMAMHPPSAISMAIILAPFILLNLKGDFRHSLGMILAVILPFLLTLPLTYPLVFSTAQSLFAQQFGLQFHSIPRVIQMYGYLPISAALLGTAVMAIRGSKQDYSLVLGLLVLLLMLALFWSLHIGEVMMYLRGLLFMMLMLGIVAGAGLMWVKRLKLPEIISIRIKVPFISRNVGVILCIVLIGFTLAIAVPSRQSATYYRMIDVEDYEAFMWIRNNLGTNYEKALLDPWKATAFTAITGKYVYARIHVSPTTKDREVYSYLKGGCADTSFLIENDISIIYSREPCSNPDLIEVASNVYLLEEAAGK